MYFKNYLFIRTYVYFAIQKPVHYFSFVFISPRPKFVFTGRGPQFVFTGSDPKFVFTPNLYLPAQPGLSFYVPTLPPQFVFTGPGL